VKSKLLDILSISDKLLSVQRLVLEGQNATQEILKEPFSDVWFIHSITSVGPSIVKVKNNY
jgi:hypothetical protein